MNLLHSLIARSLPLVPRSVVWRFASQYVAGATAEEALSVVEGLNQQTMRATLDVLGEDVTKLEETESAAAQYRGLLDAIQAEGLDANVSLKLSQFGLKLDRKACVDNLRSVLEVAKQYGNFVRIDMEDSSTTDATLEIFDEVRGEFPNTGVVLQAMLRRTVDDARELAKTKTSVRLCKGIYVEPETVAYKGRERIRESFMEAVEALVDGGSYVGIATHDDVLVERALAMIERRDLADSKYEFQMLLGVCEPLRDRIQVDHPLRVYIPFGEQWYAYSLRRLRENPAIAGHIVGALFKR